jgi:hypothetical protein
MSTFVPHQVLKPPLPPAYRNRKPKKTAHFSPIYDQKQPKNNQKHKKTAFFSPKTQHKKNTTNTHTTLNS